MGKDRVQSINPLQLLCHYRRPNMWIGSKWWSWHSTALGRSPTEEMLLKLYLIVKELQVNKTVLKNSQAVARSQPSFHGFCCIYKTHWHHSSLYLKLACPIVLSQLCTLQGHCVPASVSTQDWAPWGQGPCLFSGVSLRPSRAPGP